MKTRLPKIRVVDDAEAEQCDWVVCVRAADDPGAFPDNKRGTCSACGEPVIFRPHSPRTPPRICVECVVKLARPS